MSPLKRIIQYARAEKKLALLASLCSIINKFFDIFPEILIGVAIDVIINKQHSFIAQFGIVNELSQLLIIAFLTIIIWSLESIFEYLHGILWRKLAQKIQHTLRTDVYNHVQNLDMSYHTKTESGNLIAIINDDINQIERFFDFSINELLHLISGSLIIGGIFFYLAPLIAFVALAPLPLILYLSFYFQKKLEKRYAKIREKAGKLASYIARNIAGIETIKSYTSEKHELNIIKKKSSEYQNACYNATKVSAAFTPIVRMAVALGFITTLVLGGYYTLSGTLAISAYSIMVFQTQRLLWPFTRLAQITDMYERTMASVRRVFSVLQQPTKPEQKTPIPTPVQGSICFQNVSFSYNQIQVLNNVSLTINPGQTVAFVGATGSGKSTLIKLLLKFYIPTKGSIFLDNHNIAKINTQTLRKNISLVNQDPFLFYGTIKDNIKHGSFTASDKEIINAAQQAQADTFISHLKHGYKEPVAENGKSLSGGQKQRIALARAILKNAPIFIFDEATSAVDSTTEQAIAQSLEKITQNHTTLIVAHRLATVKNADIIYVLEKGTIVESGTHSELLKKEKYYKKLWQAQQ